MYVSFPDTLDESRLPVPFHFPDPSRGPKTEPSDSHVTTVSHSTLVVYDVFSLKLPLQSLLFMEQKTGFITNNKKDLTFLLSTDTI